MNMKKIYLVFMALLAAVTAGNAQVTGLSIGYCDGQVSTSANQAFGSSEKDIWVSGAIYVPAADVNVYGGNRIERIRAGLAQKLGIDTLTVWLRTSLTGDNLAQGGIPKSSVVKGWNEVQLEEPYQLDGQNTTGLYIGYSYHQTSSNYGLSVIQKPTPNALFVKIGSQDWKDRSGEGLLSVEALVYGESLPQLNLRLQSVELPANYVVERGTLTGIGVVKNLGVQTVTGFDVETAFEGISETYTAHVSETVAYGEEKYFSFTVSPAALTTEGPTAVTVTITKLDEGDDENLADNVATGVVDVVQHDFQRRVLLEEFTTEQCSNCPRVAGYIHELLEDDYYKENMLVVGHHSGYYTDWLTIPSDNDYLWYFNQGGSTYAPALLADRWTSPGESTPIFNPTSVNALKAVVDYRLAQPAFVSLNIYAVLDTTSNVVNVQVTGSRSKQQFTENDPRITVWLVEDGITAHSQAGSSGTYIHKNTNRSVNRNWGEVLEWTGDDYTYECTFHTRADFNADNLLVVAMVYDYDSTDATRSEVANANQSAVLLGDADTYGEGVTGIRATTAEGPVAHGVYDLQGRRYASADGLRPGLYVVNGRKVVVK